MPSKYSKERYERWKAQGVCVVCGKNQAEEGKVACKVCRARSREYYHKHGEERANWYNTVGAKFSKYKSDAKRISRVWELTSDQASSLFTQPCYYCGDVPNGKLNGIDRQDSSIGYIFENCVPCCSTCNFAKQQLLPEEFIWHCTKVSQFNKQ